MQSNQDGVQDGVYYLLSDHLGGTAITLDVEGGKVAELRYSAWGETRYTGGDTPTQRRYTGQIEAEAGLYFYQARWYDPALGRFVQADSIVPNPSSSKAWDRYAYVNNNPMRYTDLSGHCIDVQDGLCMRRVSDNSYRVVRGGSVFPNYVEVAISNSILSLDTSYINIIPNSSSGTIIRSIAAAGSQMGYGNFNTLFDQALDPSIPLVGAGVIGGWVLKPGQSGQSYIQGLEGENPDAHAWSKHGPYSSDADLFEAAKKSPVAQTRYTSESEMVLTIEQALTANIAEITLNANSGKPGVVRFYTSPVNYYGYQNHNGEVIPVSGVAPALVVIFFDGIGDWSLITAFPQP